ncbi:hypothetical protein MKX03_014494 [Papaver bracteatum]|nr:hypothetical protein MKX03_014494 [Papaver bracteatum]
MNYFSFFTHKSIMISTLFFLVFSLSSVTIPATIESPPPAPPSCQNKCGSIPIKYPFGSGFGCGSPRFYPSITCSSSSSSSSKSSSDSNIITIPQDHEQEDGQLILTTHAGTYPVTSISYEASTLTINPTQMSTCLSMHSSPNFGLDWSSPFQLGPSLFILIGCRPPTSALFSKGNPICDASLNHLCASLHSCPSILSLGLPVYSSTDTCCVYSPANLNAKGDLDINAFKCASYVSVVSLGDIPTDPNRWEYGLALKYNQVGLDHINYNIEMICNACEKSDGVCGYSPPKNNFVCVCQNGNSSSDCYNVNNQVSSFYWTSGGSSHLLGHGSLHYYVLPAFLFLFLFLSELLKL